MKNNVRKYIFLLVTYLCSVQLMSQSVSDVVAEQVGNNVEISYTLSDRSDIQITYSTDGGMLFLPMESLTGDVGVNILPGRKKIKWDVLKDCKSLISDNLIFKIETSTNPVLFSIGNTKVKLSEFLYLYKKNEAVKSSEKHSLAEYLDKMVNFKLKIKAAEDEGLDKTKEFADELNNYTAPIIANIMQDSMALDSILKLTYRRLQRIRSASHIAIQCSKNATETETQQQLARIEEARRRVTVGGESFFQVAGEVSTDSTTRVNNGKLGYIIPLRYIYAFEDAVYNTPIGQVTPVFRSPYGFHIALVEEERDNIEVHVSHIMKMGKNASARDSIYQIYRQLKNGADFETLAKKHSDDKGSAKKGGDLGWFGRGYMVKPFEDMAFTSMFREGTISEPFETKFGWHIIKYIGIRNYLPLDSITTSLLQKIRKDERYKIVENEYIRKARAQYDIPSYLNDEQAKKYIQEHLAEFNIDYRNILQEYHDGILLFDISMREVWDREKKDPNGLESFYNANKKKYAWTEPHYKGSIIYAVNQTSADAAHRIIQMAPLDSIKSYIQKRVNIDGKEYVRVETGIWKHGENRAVDKYGFKVKNSIFVPKEEFPIVEAVGKMISQPESYQDVKSQVLTDYQDYLEEEWIKKLRKKYPVKINYDVLNSIPK